MPIKKTKIFRNSLNLYKLIRLVLGQKIPDRQIARRWEMDEKNFHEFKEGKYPCHACRNWDNWLMSWA